MELLEPADGEGTVSQTTQLLRIWLHHCPKGLCRAEFVSEDSRRQVVERLRADCRKSGILFTELEIPKDFQPTIFGLLLSEQLASIPEGVVSINGFATAIPSAEPEKGYAFYSLNFSREDLARPPLRQIWWMPPHIADDFIRRNPDLNSWFLLRLKLSEIPQSIQDGKIQLPPMEPGYDVQSALDSVRILSERFEVALNQDEPVEVILDQIVFPAIDTLMKAGLERNARELASQFDERFAARGIPTKVFTQTREQALRKALKEAEERFGPTDPRTANALSGLACWLHEHARFDEAEPFMRRALEIDQTCYGPDHPSVAENLNNLAALLYDTNRLDEAEPLYRRALEINEVCYGLNHPSVAMCLNNLAALLDSTNRLDEAKPLMRRALEIDEACYGPNHPSVAIRLNNLAVSLNGTNQLDEAEPLYRKALEILEAVYGPSNPLVGRSCGNLAKLLSMKGKREEALALAERAVQILKNSLPSDHPDIDIYRSLLATISGG